jgi:pyruvate dehydrogenase E2 component (dihydrolipoamide acetyltransferase)
MQAQLGELMRRSQATARSGDAAQCAEPIGGATVQEEGFRTEGRFGRHLVLVDEPTSFGGTDSAANPAELLLAALGASLSVTLRCHAALLGLKVGRIRVELEGDLDIRGFFDADPAVRSGFAELRLHLQIESDASPEALARLMAAADRGCPVLDACRGATPISIELVR